MEARARGGLGRLHLLQPLSDDTQAARLRLESLRVSNRPDAGFLLAETHLATEQLMDTGEPPIVAWAVTVAGPLPGSRVKTN